LDRQGRIISPKKKTDKKISSPLMIKSKKAIPLSSQAERKEAIRRIKAMSLSQAGGSGEKYSREKFWLNSSLV